MDERASDADLYALRIDGSGAVFAPSDVAPAVEPVAGLQVFPNPFNPRVHITVTLDSPTFLSAIVYTTSGSRVVHLAEGLFAAGTQSLAWDGFDGRGRPMPSGIYLLRVESESGVAVRKVVLVR